MLLSFLSLICIGVYTVVHVNAFLRTRTLFSFIYSSVNTHVFDYRCFFPNIGLVIGVAYHVYADWLTFSGFTGG